MLSVFTVYLFCSQARERKTLSSLFLFTAKILTRVVITTVFWASQMALVVKNMPASTGDVRDTSVIPGYSPWVRKSQTGLKQLSMHNCI